MEFICTYLLRFRSRIFLTVEMISLKDFTVHRCQMVYVYDEEQTEFIAMFRCRQSHNMLSTYEIYIRSTFNSQFLYGGSSGLWIITREYLISTVLANIVMCSE